jgi:UDP-N-acetylmuramoyl-L-alanyl-D-glutamate--2,6-diaminopimelate ligase
MRLGEILKRVPLLDFGGDPDLEIKGLAYDSRQVKPGYLFVALKGCHQNGHNFIHDALKNGAVALVAEEFGGVQGEVTKASVKNSREALSKIAAQFYDHPHKGMRLIGITGTNGKTTTSYLLESILDEAGARTGVIGTINYRFSGEIRQATVTTPESLDLMRLLREMADGGATDVILEVSSHALHQQRTRDCPFRVAIFTNFSRDHLDYHHSMEQYFKAKSLLFTGLKKNKPGVKTSAIINTDDPRGQELGALTDAPVVTYGLGRQCQVRAESILSHKNGLKARLMTPLGDRVIRSSLIGEFNLYNILAASAAAISLDVSLDAVARGIERLRIVPGRLELVANKRGLAVVVDYAHTPDALLKIFKTLRPLVSGRLITVFGCGGDRDQGKRPEMGTVAGEHSDLVFITSDNPRTEDPAAIVQHIEKGIQKTGLKKIEPNAIKRDVESGYLTELDRRKAIQGAVTIANQEDLILIAGKGHEDYQIVGGEIRHFDDREEAALAASGNFSVSEIGAQLNGTQMG